MVGTLVVELLFRLLPVSSATQLGYYNDPEILVYPPHYAWRTATGWDLRNAQELRSNGAGFAAEREFVADANAVGLVGDSYIEASMLPAQDRPAAQLERALAGTRPVYGMGSPGSSLLDYAERVRWASRRWQVRDFVFLVEAGDIRQSLCGSGNVHSACLDRTSLEPRREHFREPDRAKRMLRESMLAQYLFGQVKLKFDHLVDETFSRTTPEMVDRSQSRGAGHQALSPEVMDAVIDVFLARVLPYRAGRMIVILDGRRTGPSKVIEQKDVERQHTMRRFREAGFTVIDAEVIYGEHLAHSPLSVEVGPYDAHLNAIGLKLVLDAAAKALREG
jgi:hypothetical protein